MPASDAELLQGFISTALPADQFHHEQHVRVAWMFVRDHGMPAALGEFTAAIKRFAEAKGAHGLYHETITWAFLLIVAERLARKPADDLGRLRRGQRGSAIVETVDPGSVLLEECWSLGGRDGPFLTSPAARSSCPTFLRPPTSDSS